jgi:fucose 4-O-acetylase-like acetyltransferase
MNNMQFGNLSLFYLGSCSGIGMTMLLSQIIPPNGITDWISKNTIIIFPTHKIAFNIFTGIGVILLGLDLSFRSNILLSIFYVIGALAVCVPATYIIRNYMPFIIGLTNKGKGTLMINRIG